MRWDNEAHLRRGFGGWGGRMGPTFAEASVDGVGEWGEDNVGGRECGERGGVTWGTVVG
ncbi:MAG: hypothetical protein ACOCUP_01035 [bacterium]